MYKIRAHLILSTSSLRCQDAKLNGCVSVRVCLCVDGPVEEMEVQDGTSDLTERRKHRGSSQVDRKIVVI